MRYFFFWALLLFIWACKPAQPTSSSIKDNGIRVGARHLSIQAQGQTIDFIKLDSTLGTSKPILLFCQGSLPIPLFADIQGQGDALIGGGITNFDLKTIQEQYHLLVVSMPETPVSVSESLLNQSFFYAPDTTQRDRPSAQFQAADYLDNYVQRANAVLNAVATQPWADARRIVVAGHSQGAKVAAKLALANTKVTHVGLFGANPFGRVDQFVRSYREAAQTGEISWTEANAAIEEQYQMFADAHQPDSVKLHPEYRTLTSFSEVFYDDWLQLNIPIFLAAGTEDRAAALCDLVPLFFIEKGKKNLSYTRYPGLEHNFFEVDETGKIDHERAHWPEVMNDFLDWVARNQ